MKCPLCHALDPRRILEDYWLCPDCDLRFADARILLTPEAEFERYKLHNNDVHDERYARFVDPLFGAILARAPNAASGLDFGAGPGPIIAKQLRERGHTVEIYDPFFHPNAAALARVYDFVFACEVIEHFHAPGIEFARLRGLLKPGGFLAVMTAIYVPEIDFESWYYRRDPTHTAFYSRTTLGWIKDRFQFCKLETLGERVAVFHAPG